MLGGAFLLTRSTNHSVSLYCAHQLKIRVMKSSKIWVCISGEYSFSMLEPKTTTEKTFLTADEASKYVSQWADNAAWERGVNIATAEAKGYHFSVNTFSATVYDEEDMSYEFCVAHPIDYAELTR